MGEEEKKPAAAEEVKKTEEQKKEEAPPKGEEKPSGEEKAKTEESKDAPPPPPPPQEIILRVYMHCEGCARKVRKSLKGFQGVEDVMTDCKSHKVVVKGEKADPLKVLERVQKKSHRQVELLSPIPKPPPAEEPKKPDEKEVVVKPQEKKEAPPQVITVVLKVHMHCEACAQEIKRRIQKMKGVENAEPDLKNSQVTVKGIFEATQLVDYVSKRTGKRAVIVKVEPAEKKEEEKPKEEEKKAEEGSEKKKAEEGGGGGDGASGAPAEGKEEKEEGGVEEEDSKLEMKKNEFLYYNYPPHQQNYYHVYPQRYAHEMYNPYPPPQMFSDENPNACSVM